LAGRITALLDLGSRLPRQLWYEEDAAAQIQRCWPRLLAALPAGALLVVDAGYTNFGVFLQMTQATVTCLYVTKTICEPLTFHFVYFQRYAAITVKHP
jgi:hypothetical protein